MTSDAVSAALAIAGMAVVTFAIRAGGFLVARVLPPTPFVTSFLRHLGASVIVALVAAALARSDVAGYVATAITIGLAAAGRGTAGLLVGMAVASLLRL